MNSKPLVLSGVLSLFGCLPLMSEDKTVLDPGSKPPVTQVDGADTSQFESLNLISKFKDFAQKVEPDLTALVKEIKNVQVKALALNQDLVHGLQAQMQFIRTHLQEEQWEKLLDIQHAHEITEFYLRFKDSRTVEAMMVVLSEKGKKTYLVNIMGDLTPEQAEKLEKRFHIRPLKEVKPEAKAG